MKVLPDLTGICIMIVSVSVSRPCGMPAVFNVSYLWKVFWSVFNLISWFGPKAAGCVFVMLSMRGRSCPSLFRRVAPCQNLEKVPHQRNIGPEQRRIELWRRDFGDDSTYVCRLVFSQKHCGKKKLFASLLYKDHIIHYLLLLLWFLLGCTCNVSIKCKKKRVSTINK